MTFTFFCSDLHYLVTDITVLFLQGSSLTICATQKLSKSISVTEPQQILRGIMLKCFAAAPFEVFAATSTTSNLVLTVYVFLFISNSGHRDLPHGYCATPPAFNRDHEFILPNTVRSPGVHLEPAFIRAHLLTDKIRYSFV